MEKTEKSIHYQPVRLEQNFQAFLQFSEHEIRDEGDVIFAGVLGRGAESFHHGRVAGSRRHQQQTAEILSLGNSIRNK